MDYIMNINNDNDNVELGYYVVTFKLDTDGDVNNFDELSQPNGKYKDLKIDNSKYIDSFKSLFDKLIKDKHFLTINEKKTDYYNILSLSYQFKYKKNKLNYYIAKTIYFYFISNYKTKVEEINNIIFIDFPLIFENFNKIINEDTNESFLKVIKNTKQKKFEYDKKIKKSIDEKAKQIALLINEKTKGAAKLIVDLKKKVNNYTTDELEAKIEAYKKDFDDKIKQINDERETLLNNRYITKEESLVNEAIEYKQDLKNINDNIENNKNKFNKLNKEIKTDRNYINIISIIIYISVFLLITLFVVLGLSSVIGGSNINISIPITFIIISLILYIIIYNYIGSNKYIYNKTYQKPNILNKIYNSFGLDLFEKFIDDESDIKTNLISSMTQESIDELDPIVKAIVTSSSVGNDSTVLEETILEANIRDKIEKDYSKRKFLVTIPTTSGNYAIDLCDEKILNVDTLEIKHNLSDENVTYHNSGLSDWNIDYTSIVVPIIKQLSDTSTVLAFVNKNNSYHHTVYTFKIPEDIGTVTVTALVIGGGSFGGHIATAEEFQSYAESQEQLVQNMGEGGAGGAVIAKEITLMEGEEYEIGVGRGGLWENEVLLIEAISSGQATCSYIKEKSTNKYIILAQGAEYIDRGNTDEYSVQLSGGTKPLITGVVNEADFDLLTYKNNIVWEGLQNDIANNTANISSGGLGGLVEPAANQVGYNLITQFGTNTDTLYLSGSTYNTDKTYSTDGHLGVNISTDFGSYINSGYVAGGGGAASFCNKPEGDANQQFYKLGEFFYTCISNEYTTFGKGKGGGGDGSGVDYGSNALSSTGGGGGGGKYKGGNGGSGLILLKFNPSELKDKINNMVALEVKKLTKEIYDIKVLNTSIENKNTRANILELNTGINQGILELTRQFEDEKDYRDLISSNDETITSAKSLIAESMAQQHTLQSKIDNYQRKINEYDAELSNKERDERLSKSRIDELTTNKNLQEAEIARLSTEKKKYEKQEAASKLAVDTAKKDYMAKKTIKLQANACKKALFAAETAKATELLQLQKQEKGIRDKMIRDATELQNNAERDAAEAEQKSNEALEVQRKVEEDYKKRKEEYSKLLASSKLEESEKGYLLSLKLGIDYRIAGINIQLDNTNLYDNLNTTEKREMQRTLEYEKQKRDSFVNDIISELTYSLSKNYFAFKEVMGTRFYVNRISSGDLKLRSDVETPQEEEARKKDEILRNYEKSLFVNEETFANFSVTEHFNTNIFRKKSESYIPPDNITVIDIEIFAHPQLLRPYALDILQEIIKQLNDLDSPIRNSRYIRYARGYKTSLNENADSLDKHTDKNWIEVKKESNLLSNSALLENNNNLMDSIEYSFDKILELNIDNETYYDYVNPLVKKEYKKYKNYENNSNIYLKMVENSTNVKLYDIRLKETIANYVITLCILLSIYIFIAKFYNNIFILIVFAIIILILTTIFLTEIYEIVHTKSNKNYWPKSKL